MTDEARIRARKLSGQFSFQTKLIQHLVDGLDHKESLLQLPFEANCLNWVLGHILSRRHSSLEALGADPLWDERKLALYKTGSEPILSDEKAIHLDALQDDLERSLTKLESALQEASDETLDRIVVNDRGEKTAEQHLEGFLWHETYHIGQLELLRSHILTARQA